MSGKGLLLKADPIAATFRAEVKSSLASATRPPRLVGILATSSAPSKFYAEFTKKQCEDLGFDFVLKKTGAAENSELGEGDGVEEAIIEANDNPEVDGIMVGLLSDIRASAGPLPATGTQVVSPYKDVEGLHFKFHYNLYHNIRFIEPKSLLTTGVPSTASAGILESEDPPSGILESEDPPSGTVKSIIPCTPLAIVKCLEHIGVYNKILPYGDRAYGRTVTVINRSEVVGRPLAALLSNDGARVFSVDIDSIQEYTKRPKTTTAPRYNPRHVVHPSPLTLQDCLAVSDVVISAVPSAAYKVKTEWLKDGCVCVNVAADKNFESDVRDKAAMYLPAVGKVTILMLLRNLMRLQEYKTSP
ncbi:NAD(P)-binding protein [Mycena kentingensis (nom. inval.)]|nr:NAD(P)-binding protein [Mycena kentingensis (nom. inval.)]